MIGKLSKRKSAEGKKPRPLRTLMIIVIILEVIGLFTVFGLFISAAKSGTDPDTAMPYLYSFIGMGVVICVTLLISGLIAEKRKRSKHSSDAIAEEIGYDNRYHVNREYPVDSPPEKKEVYYCSYCGYGSDTLIGECPECGGPIKER